MKIKSIGATSTQPIGRCIDRMRYIDRYGRVCQTQASSFAQLCAEAAEEREQIFG